MTRLINSDKASSLLISYICPSPMYSCSKPTLSTPIISLDWFIFNPYYSKCFQTPLIYTKIVISIQPEQPFRFYNLSSNSTPELCQDIDQLAIQVDRTPSPTKNNKQYNDSHFINEVFESFEMVNTSRQNLN